jgi:diguanylate cyclase (GGDEF)-like protein
MIHEDEEKTILVSGEQKDGEEEKVSSKAYLIVIKGGDVGGKKYTLSVGVNVVGRTNKADVHLDQASISRKHAEIIVDPSCKKATIKDLESLNGTFYKDKRYKEVVIFDGEQIEFGDITCKFVTDVNAEGDLLKFASVDEMTSTYNKRYFNEIMGSEFKKSVKGGSDLCLIMFDIDKFKPINDTHGHSAGDYILKELCKVISKRVVKKMTFARVGGEEFSIIAPDIKLSEAVEIAEQMRKDIEGTLFTYNKSNIPVTLSFGVCERTDEVKDIKDFISKTDSLLYLAKNTGRNKVAS